MSNGRMQFELSFGRARRSLARADKEAPFRILVLGDISGRSGAQRGTPLAQRKPLVVDVDNLDKLCARLAPRLDLNLDGAPLALEFQRIEDFHPDRLFKRLASFAALRDLRAELGDPALYRRAAAALGILPAAQASRAGAPAQEAAADIERLLGRKPAAAPPTVAGAFDMNAWLREIVAPHVVPDTADEQRRLVAAADAAIAEQMRRVLHHPAFQALEATWLGIARLVRGLESGEALQLCLLDASRQELGQDIAAAADDLGRSALYQHLCGPDTEAPDGKSWSLLVGDYAFGAGADDVALLAALGALAAHAGAPLLAAARVEAVGCGGIGQLADPRSWHAPDSATEARWNALRQSAGAAWIGLVLPRLLARLPYGASTDPIESFAFEELAPAREHEAYLWGNPAYALALLAGQAFEEDGWDMDLDAQLDVMDLPSHVFRANGEAQQQPCAEVLMGESAGAAILERGIMPLLSYRERDAARLLRWQSLADPAQALQGAWV